MPASSSPKAKAHWLARCERKFHGWRQSVARRRGRTATVIPFPAYGGSGWVRVVGRVLVLPQKKKRSRNPDAVVRGWRSFVGIPVAEAVVTVTVAGTTHELTADHGGVVDAVIPAQLEPGWQQFTMSTEGQPEVPARAFIVDEQISFGVISDVDDTVMVTALPRPFVAAWNSFVVDAHARLPVPGMSVLLDQLITSHPGSPIIYLSTGAWNVAPTLRRFLDRHLFPQGAMLLTDWGPTHDRMFRSGQEHKVANLRRLAQEFPNIRWLLIGDDGQHDEAIYAQFAKEHPDNVAAIAIRRLSPTQAMLAGGRAASDDHSHDKAVWVWASDGAGLRRQLRQAGLLKQGE